MINNFIHLHVHSHGSLQDGAQTPEQIANKAAELGMSAVALTDHGRCGELLNFYKACKKVNVKPLIGCEFYIAGDSRFNKSPANKDEGFRNYYHLPVLARTDKGRKNLFKLSSLAWTEGFYYKPRIDLEILEEYKEDLIILSGCSIGYSSHMFLQGRDKLAYDHAKMMKEKFGDNFYIEVQNHGIDWQQPLLEKLFQLSDELDIPSVITQDAHYQTKEDSELHKYICKLAAGDLEFGTDQMYFKSHEEMCDMFDPKYHHAINRTAEIADKCNCNWDYGKTIWPVVDIPAGKTTEEVFKEKVLKGFHEKFGEGTQEYIDRINYEFSIITNMGFPNYFLVVADYVQWAKDNGIVVGIGRGSGVASLVGHCLGITGLDPIKYKLPFERFLNPSRVSLPDYDMDFEKNRRHEVVQYMFDKYGADKVSQIGTYGVFKPRGSLRDFARVMDEPYEVGDKLSKMVPPDVNGKSMKWKQILSKDGNPELGKTEWDHVVKMAIKAEGMNKQAGVHAAGLLVSNTDISTVVPLFKGKGDEIASQFDMHDVEEIGLVKYDFLGLRTLTVLADAIRLIKENHNIDICLDELEKKDGNLDVYKNIFWNGDLEGVFQFETSTGFKDLCMKVKPICIKDLAAISSLFRPGPISTGATGEYAERREGKKFEYDHPKLEPILKETCGCLCFQEQVMSICVELAGYTLAESDNMRRIIGKKKIEDIAKEHDKFVNGCINNNIDKKIAEKIFKDIEGFAAYSFNLGHAAAYSAISYQTAWLKYYYPLEYYAALLNSSLDDNDRAIKYIYSAKKKEIHISPPDINLSQLGFFIENNAIIFGLNAIKGIGDKAAKSIIENRPDCGYKSIHELFKAKIKKNVIKELTISGALDDILDVHRTQMINNIDVLSEYYKKIEKWQDRMDRYNKRELQRKLAKDRGEIKLPRRLAVPPDKPELPKMEEVERMSSQDRLRLEKESLGFYISGHPLDDFSRIKKDYCIEDIKSGDVSGGVKIPVIVSKLDKKRTRKGKNMANLIIEDQTGRLEATIFPRQWSFLENRVQEGSVYIVNMNVEIDKIIDENEDTRNSIKAFINNVNEITATVIPDFIKCSLENNVKIVFEVGNNTTQDSIDEVNRIKNEVFNK